MKTINILKRIMCLILFLTIGITYGQITTNSTLKTNQLMLAKSTPVLFASNNKTNKIDFIVKQDNDLKAQLSNLNKNYPNHDFIHGELKGEYKLTSGKIIPYRSGTLELSLEGNLAGQKFLPGDQYIITNSGDKYPINTTILSQEENKIMLKVN